MTPAVAPTVDAISWRITQDEGASSVKLHVRQAKSSLFSDLSSRGNSRFELRLFSNVVCRREQENVTHHSEQKRKRMGSLPPLEPPICAAGDAMSMADVAGVKVVIRVCSCSECSRNGRIICASREMSRKSAAARKSESQSRGRVTSVSAGHPS